MKTLKNVKRIKIIVAVVALIFAGIIIAYVYMNNKTEAAYVTCPKCTATFDLSTAEIDSTSSSTNGSYHFYKCPSSGCNALIEEAHTGGESHNSGGACSICGHKYIDHTVTTSYESGSGSHWTVTICTCGAKSQGQPEVCTGGETHDSGGICTVCGNKYKNHDVYIAGEYDGNEYTHRQVQKCMVADCDYTPVNIGASAAHTFEYTPSSGSVHKVTCSGCGWVKSTSQACSWDPATCTTPKTCSKCGNTTGEALGHTWVEATCIVPKYCSSCAAVMSAPLGHTWVDATCTQPKTCSVCQETEGEALGHTWVAATCTAPKTCSVCQETEGETIPHEYRAATCTQPKLCNMCGNPEGSKLGHAWVDATCTTPKTCSRCDKTEGSALGHTWVDATCTTAKTCSTCQETEGSALGHTWVDATCTAPKTCSTCQETEGSMLDHTWGEYKSIGTEMHQRKCTVCSQTSTDPHKWTEATCTTAKTCSDCKETEGSALGHTWIDATCTAPKTCSTCQETEGSALGHTWVDATCTTPKTCSVCQETEGSALGHIGGTHENGGKCTACSTVYETHSQSTTISKYKKTGTGHAPVYACTLSGCTGTYTGTPENHTVNTWTDNTNGTHSGTCTICSFNLTKEHSYTNGTCTDCNAEEPSTECEHTYVTKNSDTQHWEECSKCKAVKAGSLETHKHTTYTDEGNGKHSSTCTVCKYKITESHTYEDGECTECNAKEPEKECTHTYVTKNDKTNHWEVCRLCNETKAGSKETHKYTTYTDKENGTHSSTCTVCKYELTEEHTYEDGECTKCEAEEPKVECEHTYEKKADKENHWEECTKCKTVKSGSLKAHIYTNYKNNQNGTHSSTCTECNYELTEEHTADCKECNPTGTTPGEDGKDDPTDGKEEPKDNTVVDDEKLPDTGVSSVVMIGIIILGAVLAINAFKVRKYKDI